MKNRGFTLIEVLIYSALIAVFMGSTILIAYNLLGTSASTQSRIELGSQQQFLRQKLAWIIRGASTINGPLVGFPGSTLSVNKTGSTENPFVIDLSNGIVRLQTAEHGPLPLTDSRVAVSALRFENFAFAGTSRNTIHVSATITSQDTQYPTSSSLDFFISIQ